MYINTYIHTYAYSSTYMYIICMVYPYDAHMYVHIRENHTVTLGCIEIARSAQTLSKYVLRSIKSTRYFIIDQNDNHRNAVM